MTKPQLSRLADEVLASRQNADKLDEIIGHFQQCSETGAPLTPSLQALERVFVELLRRKELGTATKSPKPNAPSTGTPKHSAWLQNRFRDTYRLTLASFSASRSEDVQQAVETSLNLLAAEGKYPLERTAAGVAYYFPLNRFRNIVQRLLSPEQSMAGAIAAFGEFARNVDVLFYAWKLLPGLTKKDTDGPNTTYASNYLDLIAVLPISKAVQESQECLCFDGNDADDAQAKLGANRSALAFDYAAARSNLNAAFMGAIRWPLTEPGWESVHRQLLIVLLKVVIEHLEQPILLTDLLMDSLDVGGPIALLALQGVFTLMQKHNLTYPHVYEKLYTLFEPDIFHTKFKARLFYLADIFLTSISLPQSLVAAFVKRLARLTLIVPPQDVLIIMRFVGNMLIRHPRLQPMISEADQTRPDAPRDEDPYLMHETIDASKAWHSTLWELNRVRHHSDPAVRESAKFVKWPLPKVEWDLAAVLDVDEDEMFDKTIAKITKESALAPKRPVPVASVQTDIYAQHWTLC